MEKSGKGYYKQLKITFIYRGLSTELTLTPLLSLAGQAAGCERLLPAAAAARVVKLKPAGV